ncbi:MAG: hypothetical protein ACN2B6_01240 [Rickettsiales bacterium]
MSEEKPTMSMCVNLTDYHQKTITWQKYRIEQLEARIKELESKTESSISEIDELFYRASEEG